MVKSEINSKYYAVANGYISAIYCNWKMAEPMVRNYPGAIFKSFHSLAEAEKYLYPRNQESYYTAYLYLKDEQALSLVIETGKETYRAVGNIPVSLLENATDQSLVARLYAFYVLFSLLDWNLKIYCNFDLDFPAELIDPLLETLLKEINGTRKRIFLASTINNPEKVEILTKLLEDSTEELKVMVS